MNKKRLKQVFGIALPLAILLIGISYNSYIKMHTFTLSGDGIMKNEQIQPISKNVKVTGTADTDVLFTDIESGKTYVMNSVTCETGETIRLKKGKWYWVQGTGELTVRPVNVRIE